MGKPGGGPPSPFAGGAKAAPCGRWRGIAPREGGRAGQGMQGREEVIGKREEVLVVENDQKTTFFFVRKGENGGDG